MQYPNLIPSNICYSANVIDAMSYCNRYGMDVSTCKYSDFGNETHLGYMCVPPREIVFHNYPEYLMYFRHRQWSPRRRRSRRRSHRQSK